MTRTGRIYSLEMWDAKLLWKATFFSEAFRRSYEEKAVEIQHLDDMAADLLVAEQERRQADGWEFFVGMYTKDQYKEFNNYEDSFWKALLITGDGEVVKPISVDRIPIRPFEQVMFPWLNRWTTAYRVVFPKVSLGKEFRFTLESVVGDSTLLWKVK
jgi:hypothetical protein